MTRSTGLFLKKGTIPRPGAPRKVTGPCRYNENRALPLPDELKKPAPSAQERVREKSEENKPIETCSAGPGPRKRAKPRTSSKAKTGLPHALAAV